MDNVLLKEKTSINFPEFKIFEEELTKTPPTELMVIPQTGSAKCPAFYDDTEKSLYLLEEHGYEPKVFCYAEPQDHISGFEVKSNMWDWLVEPINADNIGLIPEVFLKAIGILLENNIKMEAAAIARPKPQEAVSEVVKQELNNGLKILKEMAGILIFGILAIFAGVGKGLGSATTTFAELPDPVLLVKIQNNWIEVGRWI